MAMARLDLPSVMLYGGSIMFGEHRGKRMTVQDVFEAIGARNAGRIDDAELHAVECAACPGEGACGGQFTANTMATAFEMLGVSPRGFNDVPAPDPRKEEIAFETGRLVMDVLKKGLTPRKIITKKALLNSIAGVMATGGSTNAVLHLIAVAKEAGVKLTMDEFDRISRKTPLLADMKPWGNLHGAGDVRGGRHGRRRQAAAGGRAPPSRRDHRHRAHDRRRSARGAEPPGQKVIRALSNPIKPEGGLVILRGNLAPDGCVAKVSGQKRDFHRGPARVFDREEDAFAAVKAGKIKPNDVIVIRWEGPEGRAGHARDAARDRRHPGRRARRDRRAHDRRALLRRHPRLHDRPHRPRSRRRRPHRRAQDRRHRRHRHQEAPPRRRAVRRGDQEAPARGEEAAGRATPPE